MCAALHGLARGVFIGQSAQDQDQGIGRSLKNLVERFEAFAVGQRQVKQDHLESFAAQSFERIGDTRYPFDTKQVVTRTRARERILDQSGIGGGVFVEKDGGGGIVHGAASRGGGGGVP